MKLELGSCNSINMNPVLLPTYEQLPLLSLEQAEPAARHERASNWAIQMSALFDRNYFHARYDQAVEIDFRVGAPPLLDTKGTRWQTAIKRWARRSVKEPLPQCDPAGLSDLRKNIAHHAAQHRNITCSEKNIFIVNGAQQARNLVSRMLLGQGKTVAMEEPGSLVARLCFESSGAQIIPITVDGSGIIPSELQRLATHPPDLLYLTPSAQFPTGAVLSQSRREQIAKWLCDKKTIVVEDDNNCEFTYESRQSAALSSMARNNCIYIGSLSQVVDPSWRIAFVIVPDTLLVPFSYHSSITGHCTPFPVQSLILELMESGFLKRHLRKALRNCAENRQTLLAELATLPPHLANFIPSKAGLHQVLNLPSQINDLDLFEKCFASGVGVIPLSPFFVSNPASAGLLLNFSSVDSLQIKEGVRRIQGVLEETYGT